VKAGEHEAITGILNLEVVVMESATTTEILQSLKPMFDKAERERLWFSSPYQQLWFSPGNLREAQSNGRFRWGSVNWELRDPRERVKELREEGKALLRKADAMEQEIQFKAT
jgi:hypothetical protein